MRENNWEYALDCSAGNGNYYAADRGEAYLSYWEKGLGISWDGTEVPDWRTQLSLVARPAAQAVVDLGVHHSLSEDSELEPDDDVSDEADDVSTPLGWRSKRQQRRTVQGRFAGCLLGGAVGDALGAPVEFMKRTEILRKFGPKGITQYAPAYGGIGRITDDTQMTLFTAEGLIRAWVRGCMKGITTYSGVTAHAYLRWLQTQGERPTCDIDFGTDETGWLFQQRDLHSRRAPGNTCLAALRAMKSLGEPARNDSKGCGGVMRVAPVGLFAWRLRQQETPQDAFRLGTELAALTHGHPTGTLTGGVLAVLILALTDGASLPDALVVSKAILRSEPGHEETLRAIELAETLATSGQPHEAAISQLGQGWIAEDALAISIYCALVARNFKHGVILAVNHDGDSDSTGSITGNLLGAMHGVRAIPAEWLEPLELREVIMSLAEDLYAFKDWDIGEYSENAEMNQRIWQKYPGF
ncbi:MAG: ADP-ribosylglycohydrolase family protein [Burkholderiaceae bacterium]|nr:MAG: ADP-ribosylglycohydrolase family protein [Burkholderiaceae bacterium]